jgi:methylphosphotriester-DNA--protein-cysteine methyltransferase
MAELADSEKIRNVCDNIQQRARAIVSKLMNEAMLANRELEHLKTAVEALSCLQIRSLQDRSLLFAALERTEKAVENAASACDLFSNVAQFNPLRGEPVQIEVDREMRPGTS